MRRDVSLPFLDEPFKPSPTLAVTQKASELKAKGIRVVSFSAGEPDFDTPGHILDAARAAIDSGQTRYTAVDGTPALKSAIIEKFRRDNALEFEPEQVIASNGAKQSLYNLMVSVLNHGDEVIVPAPYWVSYPDMVKLADGAPVILSTIAIIGMLRILASASEPTSTAW